jgi:hypothetical protein
VAAGVLAQRTTAKYLTSNIYEEIAMKKLCWGCCVTWSVCILTVLHANAGILDGPVINPGNGHTYYLLEQDTWSGAEAAAVNLGGHLATIRDATENAWVFSTFGTYGGASRCLWIGLNDQAQEGMFVWSSGEPAPYRQWAAPGQPDNAGGLEDYVHLLPPGHYAAGLWNDFQNVSAVLFADLPALGNLSLNGVVEVVPEPSVVALLAVGLLTALPVISRLRSPCRGKSLGK